MIKKILASLLKKRVFLPWEKQMLSRFENGSEGICRSLIPLQLDKARNAQRSYDGRVVKIQYGSQRNILETQIPIPLSQQESVIGRIWFKQQNGESNVLRIIQINGLISMLEYKNPAYPEELRKGIVVCDIELYLRSRILIDPLSLVQVIRSLPRFSAFIVTDPKPPGFPDEIAGAKADFPEIPVDYFQLCSVCDGFLANGWEFLGLRFRQVNTELNNTNAALILAQLGYHECISLMKNSQDEWRLFRATINIEEMTLVGVGLLSSNFQEALAEVVELVQPPKVSS